jgi:hypothetical protein
MIDFRCFFFKSLSIFLFRILNKLADINFEELKEDLVHISIDSEALLNSIYFLFFFSLLRRFFRPCEQSLLEGISRN